MSKLRARLLIAEVIICFAVPAYGLFWGIITIAMWVSVVMRGGNYAIWTLAQIVGGCLGVLAIVAFLRYVTSSSERRFAFTRNGVFALAGLVAIWGLATNNFEEFGLDPFTCVAAVVPTLCFVHVLVLALRKHTADQSLVRTAAGAGVD